MTIYTSKTGEKKENDEAPPPEVVVNAWVAVEPASKEAKAKEAEAAAVAGGGLPSVVAVSRRRGKHNAANICIVLCALVVLGLGVLGGIYLYKHLTHRKHELDHDSKPRFSSKKTFRGWCGVEYFERDNHHRRGPGRRGHKGREWSRHGKFEEEVELDKADGSYERINVPAIEETRSATILHDFNKNYTAIVDNDSHRCFIMKLNRTVVKPPKSFWDLIRKLKTGYYMPKVEIIRQYYEAARPPLTDLEPYGYYIWHDCRWYTSYRLKKRPQPVAMVKRSAQDIVQYLEGNTGTDKMLEAIIML